MNESLLDQMRAAIRAARASASHGRRPRDLGGDPMAANLMLAEMEQGQVLRARQLLADFELAWRIGSPRAAARRAERVQSLHSLRRQLNLRRELYRCASTDDRLKADRYRLLRGWRRKSYGSRHKLALARAGARWCAAAGVDW